MPLPIDEKVDSSSVAWYLFAETEAINVSAMFNFRENVPEKVVNIIQGHTDICSINALYIPLLVMPQDDFLFVSLLDSLAVGKIVTPACYKPTDVTRVLIARARTITFQLPCWR